MMHFVEKLLDVVPYRLTLLFNTGEIRTVDLEPTLRARATSAQGAFVQLLEPSTFSQVRLDPASRTVCWEHLAYELMPDGAERPALLDLCPDVLYEISTPGAI